MPVPPDRVIRDLVEALIELSEPGDRHPAVGAGIEWLAEFHAPLKDETPWGRTQRVKKKPCNKCGESIFFAVRPYLNKEGKAIWVPMCPYPVESEYVILDAYTVDFGHLDAPILDPENATGQQWLPHSVLCGRQDRPLDPQIAAIWDKTAGQSVGREKQAVEGMLKLLEDTE